MSVPIDHHRLQELIEKAFGRCYSHFQNKGAHIICVKNFKEFFDSHCSLQDIHSFKQYKTDVIETPSKILVETSNQSDETITFSHEITASTETCHSFTTEKTTTIGVKCEAGAEGYCAKISTGAMIERSWSQSQQRGSTNGEEREMSIEGTVKPWHRFVISSRKKTTVSRAECRLHIIVPVEFNFDIEYRFINDDQRARLERAHNDSTACPDVTDNSRIQADGDTELSEELYRLCCRDCRVFVNDGNTNERKISNISNHPISRIAADSSEPLDTHKEMLDPPPVLKQKKLKIPATEVFRGVSDCVILASSRKNKLLQRKKKIFCTLEGAIFQCTEFDSFETSQIPQKQTDEALVAH